MRRPAQGAEQPRPRGREPASVTSGLRAAAEQFAAEKHRPPYRGRSSEGLFGASAPGGGRRAVALDNDSRGRLLGTYLTTALIAAFSMARIVCQHSDRQARAGWPHRPGAPARRVRAPPSDENVAARRLSPWERSPCRRASRRSVSRPRWCRPWIEDSVRPIRVGDLARRQADEVAEHDHVALLLGKRLERRLAGPNGTRGSTRRSGGSARTPPRGGPRDAGADDRSRCCARPGGSTR